MVQVSGEEERGLSFLNPVQATGCLSLGTTLSCKGGGWGTDFTVLRSYQSGKGMLQSQAQDTQQLREVRWTLGP